MSATVLLLVLSSALLHAAWNAVLKRHGGSDGATLAILAVAALGACLAAVFWPGPSFPSRQGVAWAVLAGVCEAGYFATLALALRRSPLSTAYTVARGGSILAVWPVSVLLLGEAATGPAIGGASLVLFGLALVGSGSGPGQLAGVAWAVLCAAFIGGYHLAYKLSLGQGTSPAGLFALALTIAWVLNLARLGRAGLRATARSLGAAPLGMALAGLVCTGSFLLFLAALAQEGAGAVLTLRNTSIVFALALGWAMGERPKRIQMAGAALVICGAMALGLGGQ